MLRSHQNSDYFNASATVRDIVIGMSDGLTVPFALAVGLSASLIKFRQTIHILAPPNSLYRLGVFD